MSTMMIAAWQESCQEGKLSDGKATDRKEARLMTRTEQSIAPEMWAIRLHEAGGPEALVLERIQTPGPGADEALVRVHAAAITPDELGWPVDRLPATPSYELSGEVVAVGPDVDTLAVGDPVWALTDFDRDGAAAEYVVVRAAFLAPEAGDARRRGERRRPLVRAERVAGVVRSRATGGRSARADPRSGRRRRSSRDPARAPARRLRDRHHVGIGHRTGPRLRRARGVRPGERPVRGHARTRGPRVRHRRR